MPNGPLHGVKVLELSAVASGPFATMLLADLGADVVKVERVERGDDTRHMDVSYAGGESGYFLGLNKNKRSIALDLKDPAAQEIVRRLMAWADVVVENFRPGAIERLGLGYDVAREVNPRIVYCSVSGFGTRGRLRDKTAYDIIGQASTGLMDITGEPGRGPVKFGAPVSDVSTGIFAALGVVSALLERERSDEGQKVDVSLAGSSIALLAPYLTSAALGTPFERVGTAHNTLSPYQAFVGSDGEHFIVAAANDTFWRNICRGLERDELAADPRFATNAARAEHRSELVELLGEIFQAKPAVEWVEILESADVPTCLVASLPEVLHEPHFRDIGVIAPVEHPVAGTIPTVVAPIEFGRTPAGIRRPPPLLDQHRAEILALLDADDERAEEPGGPGAEP